MSNQKLALCFALFTLSGVEGQSTAKIAAIEIYNVLGEKVTRSVIPSGARNLTIDLSDVPSGIYFYKVESANETIASGKLIIQ